MLLYERVDMANAFLLEYLVNGNEYACLLHIAEPVVDGCAEELHCRRQIHVCIDKRRDVVAQGANLTVKDSVVLLERRRIEKVLEFRVRSVCFQRFYR